MKRLLVPSIFGIIGAIAALNSCQNEQSLTYGRYYTYGRELYQQHCQNCHGDAGQGLGQLIPPLTDTVFLRQNRKLLPCIIKNGLSGKVTVGGKEYEGEMPGDPKLTAIDIAEIATYITNSFGNKQGIFELEDAVCTSK